LFESFSAWMRSSLFIGVKLLWWIGMILKYRCGNEVAE
jgi:hypothetical protein